MTQNRIISVTSEYEESGGPTEPATLQQVKAYLRLQGFTEDDDSGESEFDYDDELLEDMITEARMWVEKFTGVFVVERELTVVLLNQAGYIELPGPVIGDVALVDYNDTAIDSDTYSIVGGRLKNTFCSQVTATYNAGYAVGSAPSWVRNAILAYIAHRYEHRGDEGNTEQNPVQASNICRPHRKLSAWG